GFVGRGRRSGQLHHLDDPGPIVRSDAEPGNERSKSVIGRGVRRQMEHNAVEGVVRRGNLDPDFFLRLVDAEDFDETLAVERRDQPVIQLRIQPVDTRIGLVSSLGMGGGVRRGQHSFRALALVRFRYTAVTFVPLLRWNFSSMSWYFSQGKGRFCNA